MLEITISESHQENFTKKSLMPRGIKKSLRDYFSFISHQNADSV
jgi:hypothetical protein